MTHDRTLMPAHVPVIRIEEARRHEANIRTALAALILVTGFAFGAAFTLTAQALADLDRSYEMAERV